MWKALLLLYPELDVRLRIDGTHRRRLSHYLSSDAMDNALESFGGFPDLVCELTSGAATIEYEIKTVARPLSSLTKRSENEFWPSPDDTRIELDQSAPAGALDSVFVLWPQHDFECKTSAPRTAWGLAVGASPWSNGATYAAVANAPASAWRNEARGEVWLHEWLHGVCHHFAQRGLVMPEGDADGAELHGYQRSPTVGWTDYYRDLMSGRVVENGRQLGIPPGAWAESSVGSRIAAP
jgi:hypothetical protein